MDNKKNNKFLEVPDNSISCGSAVYKKKGDKAILVMATPSILKMLAQEGKQAASLDEICLDDILHPDDVEKARAVVSDAFDKEKSSECILRCINYSSGQYVWLYAGCVPVRQADGIVYAYFSFIDLSRQKEIEEELAKSRQLEQEAVMKLNRFYDDEIIRLGNSYDDCVCIMRYNINKNRMECIKGETLSGSIHAGMSLDECYKKAELFFGDEYEEGTFYNIFDKEALTGIFNSGKRNLTLELPLSVNSHTGTLWVRFKITMKKNPHTNDIIVFVIENDITYEVLTREAFQNVARTEFLSILCVDIVKNRYLCCFTVEPDMYSGNGIYMKDGDYSTTMRRIFFDMPGVSEDKRTQFLENLDSKVIREKLLDSPEYIFYYDRMVDGIDRRYKISIRWLDRKHNLVIIAKKDVTDAVREEQKKEKLLFNALEDARNANEAKTVFLSNMSHDMRTPLNGVIGFTNLAIESSSLEEKNEYLGKIKTSGEFLVQLINATLDLSKIESHKMTLCYEDTEWDGLFKSIINSVQTEAERKKLNLIVDTSKWSYSGKVYVDSLRIRQIFLNLISNAIKFTPEGGKVEFILECLGKKIKGCNCKVIVRDNGAGMSRDFAVRAFEPYSQDETKPVTRTEGTGLGLSIVKSLVEMMGGFIELESREDEGTQFTVYLPVKKSVTRWKEDENDQKSDRKLLAGHNILLCEDHPVNTDLVRLILEKEHINVVCAENGKEGYNIFKSSGLWEFDAILMDIHMPYMDGFETTEAIRKLDRKDAKDIPVIAMTANAYEEDKKKSFAAGMTAHLSKPIDVEQLFKTLGEQIIVQKDVLH